MTKPKPLSLLNCRTIDQVAKLHRDHFDYGDFCLMSDGYTTWLSEQKVGETPTQSFQIPKGVFDRLIRRYVKEQL